MIKTKIRAVARLSRMYTTLRQEQESIVLLKGLAGGVLPQGLLSQGPSAIRTAVTDFETARRLDLANEKIPPGPPPKVQEDIKPLKRTDSEIRRDLSKNMPQPTIKVDLEPQWTNNLQ